MEVAIKKLTAFRLDSNLLVSIIAVQLYKPALAII